MAGAPRSDRSLGGRWARAAVATAVGAAALSASVLAPAPAQAVPPPSADLSVSVSHAPDSGTTGDDITFTILAHNDGPDPAAAVVAGIGFDYPLQADVIGAGCRRSPSYQSLTCELGDVASGATVQVDVVLHAHGSGLLQVPVAVASDTADPDASDRVATDVVLIRPGLTQGVRYVTGVIPIILDRPADPATVQYWAARWTAAQQRYPFRIEAIPAGIINSNEYRRLRIREAYTRILGRSVDAPSLAYWTKKAGSGWSFERIERQLLASNEFRAGRDLQTIIRAVFVAELGRQPSSAELARWTELLQPNDVVVWTDLSLFLQRSIEFQDRTINRIYQDTFGHGPSSLGRYAALVALRSGSSPEAVWAKLLVGPTFMQAYPRTEDDYAGQFSKAAPVTTADVLAALAAS